MSDPLLPLLHEVTRERDEARTKLAGLVLEANTLEEERDEAIAGRNMAQNHRDKAGRDLAEALEALRDLFMEAEHTAHPGSNSWKWQHNPALAKAHAVLAGHKEARK
jgi:uncharacterized coiled-coil DUF342 family protein